ncbi:hypothetical protein [Plastoroseomonas hellenica]|uniref:Uncharacterized protein n=1 Tax=Plastoroseomonas hellenica TaxID=2687306 RepID=A0ABS5F9X7_9PROT|nr:hypothetical protein [Plastoroseomonas hellenica]MBR0647542.1 hypothetical protein [Plastoroseomonas hellenica]MBR0669352.1 hypothetical protein [Plastoroseomonas hellenica]
MFDLWSLGLFGAFALIAVPVYCLAVARNARDARKEQCVSRLLSDQLGADRR